MKRWLVGALCLAAASVTVRADSGTLSATQLEKLDREGFLTPAFKNAARELIDATEEQRHSQAEQSQLESSLPALKREAEEEETKVTALQKEFAVYAHPDETDLAELQKAMKDPHAKPEDQLALAQAYVWTYPTSPHQTEAQEDLEQIQKKIADQVQAQNDAAAAQTAAQAKLLQRVQARSLSLEEWRAFLLDKTQTEVTEYLGKPAAASGDDWTYAGVWTTDPTTTQKAGLHVTFNGGRVLTVSPIPAQ